MENKKIIKNALKEIGFRDTCFLAFQHVFAMSGATILVPLITGLNIQVTLFCAGVATLWFHFVTKNYL